MLGPEGVLAPKICFSLLFVSLRGSDAGCHQFVWGPLHSQTELLYDSFLLPQKPPLSESFSERWGNMKNSNRWLGSLGPAGGVCFFVRPATTDETAPPTGGLGIETHGVGNRGCGRCSGEGTGWRWCVSCGARGCLVVIDSKWMMGAG